MAYPDTLPSFTNPLASDPRVGHATLHGAVNDALEEVAAWVASNSLRKATVTLSSADILALHTTPVTLVAAPGAGKFLAPHRWVAYYSYGTTDYVVGADPDIKVATKAGLSVTGLLGEPNSAVDTRTGNLTSAENQPIVVTASAPITDGDGTLTITVYYSIEDVP